MIKQVFLISPSDDFPGSAEKKNQFTRCARHFGWTPVLPQYSRVKPRFNLANTIKFFSELDLIIADLSDERPSCYYELGLAEAIKCRIAVIADAGTPIHQTSLRSDVIFFTGMATYHETIENIFESQ